MNLTVSLLLTLLLVNVYNVNSLDNFFSQLYNLSRDKSAFGSDGKFAQKFVRLVDKKANNEGPKEVTFSALRIHRILAVVPLESVNEYDSKYAHLVAIDDKEELQVMYIWRERHPLLETDYPNGAILFLYDHEMFANHFEQTFQLANSLVGAFSDLGIDLDNLEDEDDDDYDDDDDEDYYEETLTDKLWVENFIKTHLGDKYPKSSQQGKMTILKDIHWSKSDGQVKQESYDEDIKIEDEEQNENYRENIPKIIILNDTSAYEFAD